MRWCDVDFERGTITVTGGEAGTKDNETRTVPMTAALRSLLTGMRPSSNSTPEALVSAIRDARTTLGKTCERLGLPHLTHTISANMPRS